jgi:hypothetical protein
MHPANAPEEERNPPKGKEKKEQGSTLDGGSRRPTLVAAPIEARFRWTSRSWRRWRASGGRGTRGRRRPPPPRRSSCPPPSSARRSTRRRRAPTPSRCSPTRRSAAARRPAAPRSTRSRGCTTPPRAGPAPSAAPGPTVSRATSRPTRSRPSSSPRTPASSTRCRRTPPGPRGRPRSCSWSTRPLRQPSSPCSRTRCEGSCRACPRGSGCRSSPSPPRCGCMISDSRGAPGWS